MKTITLPLAGRKPKAKLEDNQIAGVIYGKEIDNVHVTADVLELKRIYREAGYNSIVDVEVAGEKHEVLFKDMQVDSVYGEPVHFDLYAIVRGQKVTTDVPVVLMGDAPAAKTGLLVNTLIDTVTVSATPKNIPQQLEIATEALVEVDDTVKIGDITLPEDVEITSNSEDDVIAKVEEIKEMQVEDPDADKEMPGGELDEDGNPIATEDGATADVPAEEASS